MPVRRRGDVHNVNIRPLKNLAVVAVPFHVLADLGQNPLQMVAIHIADGQQLRPLVFDVSLAHSAHADNRLGQRVARGCVARAAKNMPGDDQDARGRADGGF